MEKSRPTWCLASTDTFMYQNINTYSTGYLKYYVSVQFWKTKSFKKFLSKMTKIECSLKIAHILMYIKYNKAKNEYSLWMIK